MGISVAYLVDKKTTQDAQKILEFTETIQSSAADEVCVLLKSTMEVNREQGNS